jgi:nicotinate-nucleotide adenylyltransferase
MEFFRKAQGNPLHLGILPGTFNPITVAHVGLARAALAAVEEVVFVLPRQFPHKPYAGASFDQRIAMLEAALADEAHFSIAAGRGGLFHEIAAECRSVYGAPTRLSFLCGRDAAERIVNWEYGEHRAIHRMLREFSLLVAARGGEYAAPWELREAVSALPLPPDYEGVSASEVRRRIAAGEDWEALVPERVRAQALDIYGAGKRNP